MGDSSVDRVAEPNPIEHSGVNDPTDLPVSGTEEMVYRTMSGTIVCSGIFGGMTSGPRMGRPLW